MAQTDPVVKRAVLTLAMGKPVYIEMAYNLARSFRWWHQQSDIQFFLATDSAVLPSRDLEKIHIIRLKPGQYGTGFTPKLHLDQIAPAEETLFLDADCLCVGNLDSVFDKFNGCAVSVVGREEVSGELFGDIAARCKAVGASWAPRFCGGLYYLKKGEVCEEVFRTARALEARYDELGIDRLRGVPNEEPLIGLGMALSGQRPVREDGSIKAEPMFFSGSTEINVFTGYARLYNSATKPKPYPEWQIPAEAHPTIVHFNCAFADEPPYTVEALRLKWVMSNGWALPLATLYAWVTRTLPFQIMKFIRDKFRPAYHALFGPRAVKHASRV